MINKFEEAKVKLKECFFGIDEQIEQVIKAFETWDSVKTYQVRPMTVCLWGLTGTGKTALINKTIELLDLNKKKFYIKFGSKTSGLDTDFSQNNCEDTIFVLDEFQYFKTKTENGSEIGRDEDNSTNVIWELLDGGMVNLYGKSMTYSYESSQLMYSIYKLIELNQFEPKLENGIISHPNLATYLKKMRISLQNEFDLNNCENGSYGELADEEFASFIKQEKNIDNHKKNTTNIMLDYFMEINYGSLFEYVKNKDMDISFNTKGEFISFITSINNFNELIKFLKSIKDAKPKLETKDFTKSLIFVLGNLDECFTMSNDLTSDLDADYFYNQTKKINLINIRQSLLTRFRTEQIARLGSTHIIYPSLNKKAFEKIINKELNSFKDIVLKKFPENVTDVMFTDEIKTLIYKEGVFPIIGARSVFSTINEIIFDKFPHIIKIMLTMKDENNLKVLFDYNKSKTNIIISIINSNNNVISKDALKHNIKVDNLRTEKNKGKQAHIAVHEAGHAVCSIVLEHLFPEVIYSVVLSEKNSGFNLFNKDDMYFERRGTYMNSIAKALGGYAAEEFVFGFDNVSNGSASDIRKATIELSSLFKDCGFLPGTLGTFVSKSFTSIMFDTSNYSIVDKEDEITKAIESKLKIGLTLAKETLKKENTLFLKISEYLSKNPKITRKKLKELTAKYAVSVTMDELNKNKEEFYTEALNKELKLIK